MSTETKSAFIPIGFSHTSDIKCKKCKRMAMYTTESFSDKDPVTDTLYLCAYCDPCPTCKNMGGTFCDCVKVKRTDLRSHPRSQFGIKKTNCVRVIDVSRTKSEIDEISSPGSDKIFTSTLRAMNEIDDAYSQFTNSLSSNK